MKVKTQYQAVYQDFPTETNDLRS